MAGALHMEGQGGGGGGASLWSCLYSIPASATSLVPSFLPVSVYVCQPVPRHLVYVNKTSAWTFTMTVTHILPFAMPSPPHLSTRDCGIVRGIILMTASLLFCLSRRCCLSVYPRPLPAGRAAPALHTLRMPPARRGRAWAIPYQGLRTNSRYTTTYASPPILHGGWHGIIGRGSSHARAFTHAVRAASDAHAGGKRTAPTRAGRTGSSFFSLAAPARYCPCGLTTCHSMP